MPGHSQPNRSGSVGLLLAMGTTVLSLWAASALLAAPAQAQAQRFLWSPGPSVGPETKVEPSNCLMADDGTITCDTRLVNPPSDTQAKPQFNYFQN
ncbi:hypothetical protein [Cyanobium sp. WAJ14-Wanaka]|uniref:hypothetical protein n=1 Tax=Cyanobium sp. WAJ14-Wanaka TaxID=2823725 RepID=UPI0020CD6FC0|nr:hypothetical protein [Cyanobium sp. WAJ14-Wanaka]